MTLRFFVGTSGWNYPHWRGRFYPRNLPQREWLAYYARRFPTVEINNTFYRLPASQTFAQWHRAVPASFVFGVKASRYITHIKRLRLSRGPVGRLLARARRLGRGLGPVLFQLPPNFRPDDARLERFLDGLPPGQRYVIEFRREGWHREPIYRLLRRRGVACCISDGAGIPLRVVRTAPFVYARFHGPGGIGAGRYADVDLRRWAKILRGLCRTGTAYVYFNNDQAGYAVENARRLTELLSGQPRGGGSS